MPAVFESKLPAKIDGKLWERILILMRDPADTAGRGRTVAKVLKANGWREATGVAEGQEPNR